MKKVLLIFIAILLVSGCSEPSGISQITSSIVSLSSTSSQISQAISSNASHEISSTPSIISAESESTLTGIDLYRMSFNEGKYDIYDLRIGDPIQNAIDEFGQRKSDGYGLGAVCYRFDNVVVAFSEGDEPDDYTVKGFDIVKKGITAYGLTTGLSTVEDIKKSFNVPESEWFIAQYAYDNYIVTEDPYDEGENFQYIAFYSENGKFYIRFFFEYGVLKVISLD